MSNGRVDFQSLGQLLGSSIPDIIILQPDWLSEVGREGGEERRKRERRGIAYLISVTVELTLRVSASFSAPAGPILFPYNLIG
jgi:hypothetical protein